MNPVVQRLFDALRIGPLLLAAFAVGAETTPPAPSLEDRVDAIERINKTAPWRVSADLIKALDSDRDALSEAQRFRIELVEARNFALAGDYRSGLTLAESLLAREIEPDLRIRALTLAVNMTTNVSDYPRAFIWMQEGLALLDQTDTPQPRLLGMASYLYLRVGEEHTALDFARQALQAARLGGSARDQCVALSDMSEALEEIGHVLQSEAISREQIDVCTRAGDPVFVADAYNGIANVFLVKQQYAEAIPWLDDARKRFDEAGFTNGSLEAGVHLAEALLHSNGSLQRARELIDAALPTFEDQQNWAQLAEARRQLSDILERKGLHAEALEQLRLAQAAHERLDRDARERRLAFLQMQFHTQVKENQIVALEGERAIQAAEIASRSRTQWLQGLGILALALITALLASVLLRTVNERRRYRELSEHDGLTGLYNHQSTLRFGRHLLARSRRRRQPFTAIVADIDCFKQINDRYGHAVGDEVLRSLGKLLQEVFPAHAVVGRSGGEEFTMLIDASRSQAHYLIDDLRRRIVPVSALGERIDYSLSYGLCEVSESEAPLEDILRKADAALYQAKRSGRNRVIEAGSEEAPDKPEPGLVVVGSGIQPNRHLSPRSMSEIQQAERVLAATDGAVPR